MDQIIRSIKTDNLLRRNLQAALFVASLDPAELGDNLLPSV
jgi:hypothetical protein